MTGNVVKSRLLKRCCLPCAANIQYTAGETKVRGNRMKIRWALRTRSHTPFRLKTAALPSSALAPLVTVTTVTPPPVASALATNLQFLSRKRVWGRVLMRVGLILTIALAPVASVDLVFATGAPSLVISQFKFTSSAGQFVTLYNQTNTTLDLGLYEVDYINSSNKLTNVPISGQLPAHGFYMLSDDQVRICYQLVLNSVSLGFSTTGGTLQIWQVSADKTVKQLQDGVTWASKATAGAVTLPAQNSTSTVSELRQPTDGLGNPQVTVPSGGTWQAVAPDAAYPCNLDIVNTTTKLPSGSSNPGNQLTTGQAPPSTTVTIADDQDTAGLPSLPASDVGLAAPQITELLPNPDGTGTDETDEFIELYNPNAVPFHLVGFTLETGTTTKHKYVFPDGTVLAPQSFTAFYSADTNLSLSNSAGQADLLDPFADPLSTTDPYGTAKDGQAWAFGNGTWGWTAMATPNAANVITQTAISSKASTPKSAATSKGGAVKGASTTAPNPAATASTSGAAAAAPAPIHPYVLVAVAVLAVGYGVYEYRHDLANRIHELRRNRTARRVARA